MSSQMTSTPAACQHCGEPVPGPRSKQCKACATLKTDANRAGTYASVVEALAEGQRQGLTGQELRDYASQSGTDARAAFLAAHAGQRSRRAEALLRDKARERENVALRAAGYRWVKHDEEAQDFFNKPTWELVGPDGEVVLPVSAPLAGDADFAARGDRD